MKFQIILLNLITNLRNIYDRYNCICVPYKSFKITEKMSRNKSIMILKQDKGREIVVIDRKKYTEKCLNVLHTGSFIQLDHVPMKTLEGKIQRSIHTIESN